MWDPAEYVQRGKLLAQGVLTPVGWNPLVSAFYAVIYLFVGSSPFWLIHAYGIGRFVLYVLIWLSGLLIAGKGRSLFQPWMMTAMLFVSPVVLLILNNGSDATFAVMSALAFWQILSFHENEKMRHLITGSAFVGLSALARNDGLVLIVIFISLGISIHLARTFGRLDFFKRLGVAITACLIPFILIVGVYASFYGLVTGRYDFGTVKRLYDNFEFGEGVAYRHLHPDRDSFIDGVFQSRRLYGTPEENKYSVVLAIKRNPRAYFRRVIQMIKQSPKLATSAYGEKVGILLFILAGMGMIELIRRKEYSLLVITLSWPLHIMVSFIAVIDPRRFVFPYFDLFFLACVGASSLPAVLLPRKYYFCWVSILVFLAMLAVFIGGPTAFTTFIIIASAFAIGRFLLQHRGQQGGVKEGVWILLLVLALILREPYPAPKFRNLGEEPAEKAILYLHDHMGQSSFLASYSPGYAFASNMKWLRISYRQRDLKSGKEFVEWMKTNHSGAILVDPLLRDKEPYI